LATPQLRPGAADHNSSACPTQRRCRSQAGGASRLARCPQAAHGRASAPRRPSPGPGTKYRTGACGCMKRSCARALAGRRWRVYKTASRRAHVGV